MVKGLSFGGRGLWNYRGVVGAPECVPGNGEHVCLPQHRHARPGAPHTHPGPALDPRAALWGGKMGPECPPPAAGRVTAPPS